MNTNFFETARVGRLVAIEYLRQLRTEEYVAQYGLGKPKALSDSRIVFLRTPKRRPADIPFRRAA